MGKARARRKRVQRIRRVQRRLAQQPVILLGKRRRSPGQPQRQHHPHPPAARDAVQHGQHVPHRAVPAGKDIALPRPPPLAAGQYPRRHVAHIHKVITAVHARGQTARAEILHQLRQVSMAVVIRAADARGMHDADVQPPRAGRQRIGRGRGLCFGVQPNHRAGAEHVRLRHQRAAGLFRQRVHRAYMHQLFHAAAHAGVHHVFCARHIYVINVLVEPGGVMLPSFIILPRIYL